MLVLPLDPAPIEDSTAPEGLVEVLDIRGDSEVLALPFSSTTILIDGATCLSSIVNVLSELERIVINFDSFADGRGFSLARQLKNTVTFRGHICASGHFILDQFQYLLRCGFDEAEVTEESYESFKNSAWLQKAGAFSVVYQSAADNTVYQPAVRFGRSQE